MNTSIIHKADYQNRETYLAGNKLSLTHATQKNSNGDFINAQTTRYVDHAIFKEGVLDMLLLEQGCYLKKENGQFVYYAQIADYQGSIVSVVDENGNETERNDYYPFGKSMNISDPYGHQPYKYNGKEDLAHVNLDWLDYGARMYFREDNRWGSMDPLAENAPNISPYVYCFNNPIKFVDPDGQWPWEAKNVRQARSHARQTGGTFEKWKSSISGRTFASVQETSATHSGESDIMATVYKPSKQKSRGGLVLSTSNGDLNPQGPAISTGLDGIDNLDGRLYTNIDDMNFIGPAKNYGEIPGMVNNVVNGMKIFQQLTTQEQKQKNEKIKAKIFIDYRPGSGEHKESSLTVEKWLSTYEIDSFLQMPQTTVIVDSGDYSKK